MAAEGATKVVKPEPVAVPGMPPANGAATAGGDPAANGDREPRRVLGHNAVVLQRREPQGARSGCERTTSRGVLRTDGAATQLIRADVG